MDYKPGKLYRLTRFVPNGLTRDMVESISIVMYLSTDVYEYHKVLEPNGDIKEYYEYRIVLEEISQ